MLRSRPKSRKTKYLSLRRHVAPRANSKPKTPPSPPRSQSPPPPPPPPPVESTPPNPSPSPSPSKQAKQLFPLIQQQEDPPDVREERDPQVASLLFSSTNGETGETLTEILGTGSSASAGPLSDSCSAGSPGSPAVGLDSTENEDNDGLARRALRGRQRVEYCCTSSSSEEEVASASRNAGGIDLWCGAPAPSPSPSPSPRASLLLKLDNYEEILTAWSDRGSLYIGGGEPAQVVPGFHHTAFPFRPVWVAVGTCSGEAAAMAWTVPEKEEEEKAEQVEVETREMRVRRYKEKRQNRLFAKKIRYEVRKLNAEKRPRLKGRFIKAMEDV